MDANHNVLATDTTTIVSIRPPDDYTPMCPTTDSQLSGFRYDGDHFVFTIGAHFYNSSMSTWSTAIWRYFCYGSDPNSFNLYDYNPQILRLRDESPTVRSRDLVWSIPPRSALDITHTWRAFSPTHLKKRSQNNSEVQDSQAGGFEDEKAGLEAMLGSNVVAVQQMYEEQATIGSSSNLGQRFFEAIKPSSKDSKQTGDWAGITSIDSADWYDSGPGRNALLEEVQTNFDAAKTNLPESSVEYVMPTFCTSSMPRTSGYSSVNVNDKLDNFLLRESIAYDTADHEEGNATWSRPILVNDAIGGDGIRASTYNGNYTEYTSESMDFSGRFPSTGVYRQKNGGLVPTHKLFYDTYIPSLMHQCLFAWHPIKKL